VGNSQVSSEFRDAYGTGLNSAHFETTSGSDGLPRIFTFQRVSRAPMLVNAGVSTKAYLADWTSSAYKSLALTAGFVVMSTLMGLGLLRLLNRMQKESTRNRVYLQHASDGVQIIDASGKVVEANERFCSMTGYDRATLLAMSPREWASCWPDIAKDQDGLEKMLSAPSGYTRETAVRCSDGHMLTVEVNCSGFSLGSERFAYASVRDITERRAATEKIEQLAFYDPLTQLPNRRLLLDRLSQALASSTKHQSHGALMMIDIDNFKNLNDTYGHDVGDQFLKEVATRIQSAVLEGDTAARFGGDEFIVMLEDLGDAPSAAVAAEAAAEKILSQLRKPYLLKLQIPQHDVMEHSHHCTCSIGVTLFVGQADSPDELMKRADTAMYQAKAAGRDTLRFFDPKMQASVTQRAAMEADLRHAMDDKQFALHYQPQVDYRGKCFGVEALLRWQHPTKGLVSPAEFIPLAEETGLILTLGKWVMDTASAQIQSWASVPGMAHLTMSVNVSARQFHQSDFVDQVLDTLAKTTNCKNGFLDTAPPHSAVNTVLPLWVAVTS
jgi:diguanylate cyclase (GGDEF)-like protein/PAS domain S-box-containing protein